MDTSGWTYDFSKKFFEKAKKDAEDNDIQAIVAMINIYWDGLKDIVDSDKAAAIEYMKKAADLGSIEWSYNYGLKIKDKDFSESLKYLKYAADRGYTDAQYLIYLVSSRTEYKIENDIYYLMDAGMKGSHEALEEAEELASIKKLEGKELDDWMINFSYDVLTEFDTNILKEMALDGNVMAMVWLGYIFYEGYSGEKDETEALYYWEKAGKIGNFDALQALRLVRKALGENDEQQREFLKKINKNQVILDEVFKEIDLKEENIKKNDEVNVPELIAKLEKDIIEGDVQSMVWLGDIYYKGADKIQPDVNQAFKYWEMAADAGNAMCCTKIAMSYYHGMNVDEDKAKAYKYFKKAASLDEPEALYFLGQEYNEGNLKDTENSYEMAKSYLDRAARKGHAQAQIDLSELMFKDDSATVDDVLFWLACAYLHKGTKESQQANKIMQGMVERNIPGGKERIIEKVEEVKNGYSQYLKNSSYMGDKINEAYKRGLQFDKNQYAVSTENNSSEGCYIATSVYGSYDCPEVWTLRRFRDFYLRRSCFGKGIVKLYYRISPSIVRMFGKTRSFNLLNRMILDRLVNRLNKIGYKDTYYLDRFK